MDDMLHGPASLPPELEPVVLTYHLPSDGPIGELDALIFTAHTELTAAAWQSTEGVGYYSYNYPETHNILTAQHFVACSLLPTNLHKYSSRSPFAAGSSTPNNVWKADFLRVSLEAEEPLWQERDPDSVVARHDAKDQAVKWRRYVNLGATPVSLEFVLPKPNISRHAAQGAEFDPQDKRFVSLAPRRQLAVDAVEFPAHIFHALRGPGQLIMAHSCVREP